MELEVKDLTFRYHKSQPAVFQNFYFSVKSEERVGVLAPSGFGKSTFARILAGLEEGFTGEILLDKKPVSSYGRYCPVQLIWQHPEEAVDPRMTMREMLAEGDNISRDVLDGLGIEEDWLKRFPLELSGGELQRFVIARALGERTKFLIADEITAMHDLVTQSQIWRFLIEETKRRKIGLIVFSHSSPLLEQICTRIDDWQTGKREDVAQIWK